MIGKPSSIIKHHTTLKSIVHGHRDILKIHVPIMQHRLQLSTPYRKRNVLVKTDCDVVHNEFLLCLQAKSNLG